MSIQARIGIVAGVLIIIVAAGMATARHAATPAPKESATASPVSSAQAVVIRDMDFAPQALTVKAGETVTWTNQDSVSHTVTIDSGSGPDSGSLAPGASYSYTFEAAGSYPYHCAFHPAMVAAVTVTP